MCTGWRWCVELWPFRNTRLIHSALRTEHFLLSQNEAGRACGRKCTVEPQHVCHMITSEKKTKQNFCFCWPVAAEWWVGRCDLHCGQGLLFDTHLARPAGLVTRWSCPRRTRRSPCAACRCWSRWGRPAPAGTPPRGRSRASAGTTAPTRASSAAGAGEGGGERKSETNLYSHCASLTNLSEECQHISKERQKVPRMFATGLILSLLIWPMKMFFTPRQHGKYFSLVCAAAAHRPTWCRDQFLVSRPQVWRQEVRRPWWLPAHLRTQQGTAAPGKTPPKNPRNK